MAVVTTPYKNAPEFVGEIQGEYILVIQKGNNTGATGRAEMMRITLAQLQAFINKGFGSAWRFRGSVSSLPNDPVTNDYFLAATTFTADGKTYVLYHLYGYNGSTWSDISGLLEQYATVEALAELDDKVDALIGSGISFKGQITYAELMQIAPSSSNIGWEYYVTDKNSMYVSDGTVWIQITKIAQTTGQSEIELMSQKAITDAISDEESARTSADSDLQAQLVNVNAELDNVEALIGGDAQVENTDPTEGESLLAQSRLIHHANLLPNGDFGRVGARSVAFNQLMYNGNFSASNPLDGWESSGSTLSASGGVMTITPNSANGQAYRTFSFLANHTYLLVADMKLSAANATTRAIIASPGLTLSEYCASNTSWQTITKILASPTAGTGYVIFRDDSSNSPFFVRNVNFFDLTAMNEASLTADQFRALFPASYYPHDTGHIYNLNPSGFRIRGINLWDEEWEKGLISPANGIDADGDTIRTKNYIEVAPNTEYYGLTGRGSLVLIGYDENKNFISHFHNTNGGSVFTTPVGCFYIRFYCQNYGSIVYNHDVQVADNSLPTSVKTVYHPYDGHIVDTPQISDGHYVNENCYDYVENVVEDGIVKGKKHTITAVVNLTELAWSAGFSNYIYATINDIKRSPNSATKPNILCSNIVVGTISDTVNSGVNAQYITVDNTNSRLLISTDSTKTWRPTSGIVYYETVSEVISDCEPLRSFGISDYSTVEPITPQDELLNRIDVPYSVKTVSANTLIEQITQNTADIAEEKATRTAQVSALEKRVTNLELKTGGQFDVDYPSPTYGMNGVPSNVEPYAKVTKLRGVTRGVNQYCITSLAELKAINVAGTWNDNVYTSAGWTATVDEVNHKITLNGTVTALDAFYLCVAGRGIYTNGQRVLLNGCASGGSTTTYNLRFYDGDTYRYDTGSGVIFDSVGTSRIEIQIRLSVGANVNGLVFTPVCSSLSKYFSSDPSVDVSTLTISDIQTKYPELLIPSDYDAGSLVSTVYEGVRSKGINLFDGNWTAQSATTIVGTIVPIKPNTQYYCRFENLPSNANQLYFGEYDESGTLLAPHDCTAVNGTAYVSFTSNANGAYIKPQINHTGSAPTGFKTCVNLYALNHTAHFPYFDESLSLPSPLPLRSAGSVADVYDLESGEVTHPTRLVNLGTLTWIYETWNGLPNFYTRDLQHIIKGVTPTTLPNLTSDMFPIVVFNDNQAGTKLGLSVSGSGNLDCRITNGYTDVPSFTNWVNNHYIVIELATADPSTQLAPISDNFVKVEPNGTIETVQSQSPKVDGAMTVEYMAS